jgi:ribosomal protein S18 acetylase RimI-like enzyme
VEILESTNRDVLAAFFGRFPAAHAYGLADLDAPFWPHVRAFTAREDGETVAVALLLDSLGVPLLYAVALPGDKAMTKLLRGIEGELPLPCVATVALGVPEALGWRFDSAGEFLKMRLRSMMDFTNDDHSRIERLTPGDLTEVQRFYTEVAYEPGEGGFFQPYMLELGPYFGVRENGELIAAGGVHVLSERYGVTGLGNIATAPTCRGRGLASNITRVLCQDLAPRIPLVALNVRRDNTPAVRCYRRAGFDPVLLYEEGWIRAI